MPPTDQKTYTPGAREAAKILFGAETECFDEAAAIISRETHDAEMLETLKQADLQIEYMQSKFRETGTGNAVRAQIQALIAKVEGR